MRRFSIKVPRTTPHEAWAASEQLRKVAFFVILFWLFAAIMRPITELEQSRNLVVYRHALITFGGLVLGLAVTCLGIIALVDACRRTGYFPLVRLLLLQPLIQLLAWLSDPIESLAVALLWTGIVILEIIVPPGTVSQLVWTLWVAIRQEKSSDTELT